MERERWREIEELFQALLPLGEAERRDLLRRDEIDPDLIEELESLFGPAARAELSLSTLVDGAAALLAEEPEPVPPSPASPPLPFSGPSPGKTGDGGPPGLSSGTPACR